MAAATRHLELSLLPERYAISRLAADAPIPAWAMQGPFFSVTRTGDELSIVSELSLVPIGVPAQSGWPRTDLIPNGLGASLTAAEPVRGWRVLKVHGPFVLSEIGVLAALAMSLAEGRISLFAVSTFDTDYLLVASETLPAAIAALEQAGHTIYRSLSE